MPQKQIQKFKKTIWVYHTANRRDLPWRNTHDPYKILVSEMMLQQTQVSRVLIKYKSFLKKYPSVKTLAKAKLSDVLREWQGLGYNRRAMYLKRTAEVVVNEYAGKFPQNREALMKLPGIGQSTAGALLSFAFEIPTVIIETNIRSVFIHFFLSGSSSVSDKVIEELVTETLDTKNPREWYYALYDYGAYLKASRIKTHRKSATYKQQSKFTGSNRELRSLILKKLLTSKKYLSLHEISDGIIFPEEQISTNLVKMVNEGLLKKRGNLWKAS